MDVKVLETIRKNLFSMLDSSVSYEEWAEEFVNILRKIVPNQLICKMIMDCYIVKNCDYFGRFVVVSCNKSTFSKIFFLLITFSKNERFHSAGEERNQAILRL